MLLQDERNCATQARHAVLMGRGYQRHRAYDPRFAIAFVSSSGEGGAKLGKKDMGTSDFPAIETGLTAGDVAFRQHSGGHTPAPNWPTFMAFADRYFTR